MAYTLRDLAIDVLRAEKRPMTTNDMWNVAVEKGLSKKGNFRGKTPDLSIGALIYVDLRDNPDSTPFVKLKTKPVSFYLKDLSTGRESEEFEAQRAKSDSPTGKAYSERDLHPLLAYFAYNYLNAQCKTIFHEKSSKKTFAQWLHPDVVGVHYPIVEWEQAVMELSISVGATPVKLFSFELKKQLGFANLREAFFQAVSNSS